MELGTDLSPLSGKGASEMDEGVKISVLEGSPSPGNVFHRGTEAACERTW